MRMKFANTFLLSLFLCLNSCSEGGSDSNAKKEKSQAEDDKEPENKDSQKGAQVIDGPIGKARACEDEALKSHTTPFLEVTDSASQSDEKWLIIAGLDGTRKGLTLYHSVPDGFDVNSKEEASNLGIGGTQIFKTLTIDEDDGTCLQYTLNLNRMPNGNTLIQLAKDSKGSNEVEKRLLFKNEYVKTCEVAELREKTSPYLEASKTAFSDGNEDKAVTYDYSNLDLDSEKNYYLLLIDAEKDTLVHANWVSDHAYGPLCQKEAEYNSLDNLPAGKYKFVLSTAHSYSASGVVMESKTHFTVAKELKCAFDELKSITSPEISMDKAEYKVGEQPTLTMAGFPGGSTSNGGLEVEIESISDGIDYGSYAELAEDESCGKKTLKSELSPGEYEAKLRNSNGSTLQRVIFKVVD